MRKIPVRLRLRLDGRSRPTNMYSKYRQVTGSTAPTSDFIIGNYVFVFLLCPECPSEPNRIVNAQHWRDGMKQKVMPSFQQSAIIGLLTNVHLFRLGSRCHWEYWRYIMQWATWNTEMTAGRLEVHWSWVNFWVSARKSEQGILWASQAKHCSITFGSVQWQINHHFCSEHHLSNG